MIYKNIIIILFFPILLVSCSTNNEASIHPNELLISSIYDDYYYQDKFQNIETQYFNLIWAKGNEETDLYVKIELPKLANISDNIIDSLRDKNIYEIDDMKINSNIFMLPIENKYIDFIEKRVKGISLFYFRTIVVLDQIDFYKDLSLSEKYHLNNRTIIHEFTHSIFTGLFDSNIKDEMFASFISFQFSDIDNDNNEKNLQKIKIKYKEDIIEIKKNNHSIMDFLDSKSPVYLKENIGGLYLTYLYDSEQFYKIKNFLNNKSILEYAHFKDTILFNKFIIWMES